MRRICASLLQNVSRCRLIPAYILAAQRGRPHQIEDRREVDDDVDGVTAIHRVSH